MFPISTIKRYFARRKERRDNVRYLKCSMCGCKFWGHLPTAQHVVAFHAHCPRCQSVVDEHDITETRRQKIAKVVAAVGAATWAVIKYPVQPFTANTKIVRLEAKVVEEVARVEAKVDAQGQMIVKRLDLQDNALQGIGSMISGIRGQSDRFENQTPPLVPHPLDDMCVGYKTSIPYDRFHEREMRVVVIGHCTYYDTTEIRNGTIYFFDRCGGKMIGDSQFYYDHQLVGGGHVVIAKRISMSLIGDLTKREAEDLLNHSYLSLQNNGNTILETTLKNIYDGRAHIASVVFAGGNCTKCYASIQFPPEGKAIRMRVSIEGVEGLLC